MSRKEIKTFSIFVIVTFIASVFFISCSKKQTSINTVKIKFATPQNNGLYDFVDEDGVLRGLEPDLLREVDKRLDKYEFELIPTSYDDAHIGISVGTYDGVIGTKFLTKERLEKFNIPKEPLAKVLAGMVIRKEYADGISSISDLAKKQKLTGLTIAPLKPGEGHTYIYELYNEEHPDNQLSFELNSEVDFSEIILFVCVGRYDAAVTLEASYEQTVKREDGAYHEYSDHVSFVPTENVGGYAIFNPNIDSEFIDEYVKALKEIKADGTASKISVEYFGRDIFSDNIKDFAE